MYRLGMQLNHFHKTHNIGNRAFIFGGAYGNLQATQAILEKAKQLGFSSSNIIFTGDMVAYCANPMETVTLIKDKVDHIIMGNCEEAIANGSEDCGCGFNEGSKCSILSNQWYNFCLSKIDKSTAKWMATLVKNMTITIGNSKFFITHATPKSINEFVFSSTLNNSHDCLDVDGYITGHSGIPFIGSINNKPWINSGAGGMPANDGTSNIWFATIQANENQLEIETHSLQYDYSSTQKAMKACGLSNGYMECLETGIWPSHDALPRHEKSQTGIYLESQKRRSEERLLENLI